MPVDKTKYHRQSVLLKRDLWDHIQGLMQANGIDSFNMIATIALKHISPNEMKDLVARAKQAGDFDPDREQARVALKKIAKLPPKDLIALLHKAGT